MLKLYDAHGDIWYDIVQHSQKGERDIFRKYQLPKFQKGGVMGGTFVMWIDPPHDEDPKRRIKEIEKAVKQELEDAADILNIVRKYEDFEKGTKEGKINVMMGLEGLSYIGEDIDQINYYYEEFGVRTMMLTWNEENALASGWPGDPERGLTAKGKEAIRRMNELGMVLDVSHINDKGFWDILELSDGHPVIASHSNARAVSPHEELKRRHDPGAGQNRRSDGNEPGGRVHPPGQGKADGGRSGGPRGLYPGSGGHRPYRLRV